MAGAARPVPAGPNPGPGHVAGESRPTPGRATSAPCRGARTRTAIADRGDRRPGSPRRGASRGGGSPAPGRARTRWAAAEVRSPRTGTGIGIGNLTGPRSRTTSPMTRAIPVPRNRSAQFPGSQAPASSRGSAVEKHRLPSGRVNRSAASTNPAIGPSHPGGQPPARHAPARISRHRGQSRIASRRGTPSASSSRSAIAPAAPGSPPLPTVPQPPTGSRPGSNARASRLHSSWISVNPAFSTQWSSAANPVAPRTDRQYTIGRSTARVPAFGNRSQAVPTSSAIMP